MRNTPNWLHTRYQLDVDYCRLEEAPLLAGLCKAHGLFWDGKYCYRIEKGYIKRFPEWRTKVRVPLEKTKDASKREKSDH